METFCVYLRVSTKQQGRSGLGLEAQRSISEDFVAKRGGLIVATYTEVASGKLHDRVALAEAQAYCKRHKATLLVAKLDRAGRNAYRLLEMIEHAKAGGYGLLCADYPDADITTLQLFAVLAEHEGRMISKRTKDALAVKKAQGCKLGAPDPRPGGNATGAILRERADSYALNTAPLIEQLRASGMGYRSISSELTRRGIRTPRGGVWYPTSVRNILERAERIGAPAL
jgi:DNA invertase Pin-like site-specific DNA recombinase